MLLRTYVVQPAMLLRTYVVQPAMLLRTYVVQPAMLLRTYVAQPAMLLRTYVVQPAMLLRTYVVQPAMLLRTYVAQPAMLLRTYVAQPAMLLRTYVVQPAMLLRTLSKLVPGTGGGVQGAGSVLDRVISQPSSEDHTVLYKLANYKKGTQQAMARAIHSIREELSTRGLLLETYTRGGMVAAERLIREEFVGYMYAGGRGRVINRAEYLRWKFRDQEQVTGDTYTRDGMVAAERLIREEFVAYMYAGGRGRVINRAEYLRWKFRDQEQVTGETYTRGGMVAAERLIREEFVGYMYAGGRGRMCYRGALGESLLHVLIICDTKVTTTEGSLSPYDPLAQWGDHTACWQMCYRGALGESLLHVLIICDTKVTTPEGSLSPYDPLAQWGDHTACWQMCYRGAMGESLLHVLIICDTKVTTMVASPSPHGPLAQWGDHTSCWQMCYRGALGESLLHVLIICDAKTNYEGLAYLGEYPLAWAACCANEAVYNLLLDSGAEPDRQDSAGNMILHMVVVTDKLDMFGYALRHPKVPASNGRTNRAGFTPLTLACQLGRASVFREMLELSAREFWRYSNITSLEAEAHPGWGLEVSDAKTGIRLASELGTILSTLCYIVLQQGDEIKNQGL
ncbi:Transient receptor potential cation channel subfamily V member 6, partial [Operophtera brumata]